MSLPFPAGGGHCTLEPGERTAADLLHAQVNAALSWCGVKQTLLLLEPDDRISAEHILAGIALINRRKKCSTEIMGTVRTDLFRSLNSQAVSPLLQENIRHL